MTEGRRILGSRGKPPRDSGTEEARGRQKGTSFEKKWFSIRPWNESPGFIDGAVLAPHIRTIAYSRLQVNVHPSQYAIDLYIAMNRFLSRYGKIVGRC